MKHCVVMDFARILLVLCLPTLTLSAPAKRKAKDDALYMLKGGKEYFGHVVLESGATLYLRVDKRLVQVKASDVLQIIPREGLSLECRSRRRKLADNAEAHYPLAVWARKVGTTFDAGNIELSGNISIWVAS